MTVGWKGGVERSVGMEEELERVGGGMREAEGLDGDEEVICGMMGALSGGRERA